MYWPAEPDFYKDLLVGAGGERRKFVRGQAQRPRRWMGANWNGQPFPPTRERAPLICAHSQSRINNRASTPWRTWRVMSRLNPKRKRC